ETDLTLAFVTSAEYRAAHATPAAYVDALFRDLLGRPATDPSFWVGQLNKGVSRRDVALALLNSPEALGHAVRSAYNLLFHSPVDPGGLAFWVGLRQQGFSEGEVLVGLLASDGAFAVVPRR